jgi:hypothetical protein
MPLPRDIREQLRGTTFLDLVRALKQDGFKEDTHDRHERLYIKQGPTRLRVSVNWSNPEQRCGRLELEGIIEEIGWSIDDLKRFKLIK